MAADGKSELNVIAHQFGAKKRFELQAELAKMIGFRATHKLYNSVKEKFGYDIGGDVFKIGFTVLRYGILFEKGVGKDVGMKNGVRFPTAKNNLQQIKRKQNPWISNVLSDEAINQLANEVSKVLADTTAKKMYDAVFDGNKKTFEL